MTDRIFESWLQGQKDAWDRFAPMSDRVSVAAIGPETPSRRFVAEFTCRGLVKRANGEIAEADQFAVAIHFGNDHLRRVDPLSLVWLLSPPNVWHPNVRFPGLCVGHLRPGVGLIDVLHQVHSILTYQNCNLRDFLNPEAMAWAREQRDRFPIDRRPLKRRDFQWNVTEVAE